MNTFENKFGIRNAFDIAAVYCCVDLRLMSNGIPVIGGAFDVLPMLRDTIPTSFLMGISR